MAFFPIVPCFQIFVAFLVLLTRIPMPFRPQTQWDPFIARRQGSCSHLYPLLSEVDLQLTSIYFDLNKILVTVAVERNIADMCVCVCVCIFKLEYSCFTTVSFCCTVKCINYMYTYVSSLWTLPSHPYPAPLGHHRAVSYPPCPMQQTPASSLFYTW